MADEMGQGQGQGQGLGQRQAPSSGGSPLVSEAGAVEFEDEAKVEANKPSEIVQSKDVTIYDMGNAFLESDFYVGVMAIITIWAIFSDNIRVTGTDTSADDAWNVVITIIFIIYVFEIVISILCKNDYMLLPQFIHLLSNKENLETAEEDHNEDQVTKQVRKVITSLKFGSFYLWVDLIATLSFMFEISWMLGEKASKNYVPGYPDNFRADQDISRKGSLDMISELERVIRMVRLTRLVKLYKYYAVYETRVIREQNELEDPSHSGSKIGGAMGDVLSRRVIVLILTMLIVIPLLLAQEVDQDATFMAVSLHKFAVNNVTNPSSASTSALDFQKNFILSQSSLVYARISDETWHEDQGRLDSLRPSEINSFYFVDDSTSTSTALMFDTKREQMEQALSAIYLTLFVLVLLIGGIKIFEMDVKHLVVAPIEKMVDLVKKISVNPLGVEYNMLSEEAMKEGMETAFLLQTINKIGSLMRIGFGEAGAVVIAKNLGSGGGGSKLNLMGGGEMIHSIFGFCDVRQFTDTTECLQEEVMLFVNRIAFIIHGIVVQCSGAANKNIGDAFLLTWKIPADTEPHDVSRLADQSLLAFCKTMVELGRGQEFICNFSVSATGRLYKRFPGYKVRIGAGLHVGWAVEGAIGSNSKIDASYLSPHVNRTEFLESSTKAYGVPLLISEPFFKMLSPYCSKYCRLLDRVRTSPEEEPFNIYTYDMDVNLDFWDLPKANKALRLASSIMKSKIGTRRTTINVRANKQLENNSLAKQINEEERQKVADQRDKAVRRQSLVPTTDIEAAKKPAVDPRAMLPNIKIKPYRSSMWEEDNELVQLRHMVNDSFRALWREGVTAYIKGDWPKARDILHECLKRTEGKDGPSKNLIDAIDHEGGSCPKSWPGYRMDGDGH